MTKRQFTRLSHSDATNSRRATTYRQHIPPAFSHLVRRQPPPPGMQTFTAIDDETAAQ